jgi:hypothetical protein
MGRDYLPTKPQASLFDDDDDPEGGEEENNSG